MGGISEIKHFFGFFSFFSFFQFDHCNSKIMEVSYVKSPIFGDKNAIVPRLVLKCVILVIKRIENAARCGFHKLPACWKVSYETEKDVGSMDLCEICAFRQDLTRDVVSLMGSKCGKICHSTFDDDISMLELTEKEKIEIARPFGFSPTQPRNKREWFETNPYTPFNCFYLETNLKRKCEDTFTDVVNNDDFSHRLSKIGQ